MLAKGSKMYSILLLKCPRCHKGAFLENNPYKLSSFNKVKQECSCCRLRYSIEPSFYYGSMYVSYGVGIAVAVAVFVLIKLFGLSLSPVQIFMAIVIALVVLMPYIGAVSKSIWANIFFRYEPKYADKHCSN